MNALLLAVALAATAPDARVTRELDEALAVAPAAPPTTAPLAAAPPTTAPLATARPTTEPPPLVVGARAPETGAFPWVAGGGLVALAGAAWLAARRKRGARGSLSVVESTALGKGRAVVIVDVEGRRILLGVTDHGITLLSSLPAHEGEAAPAREAPLHDERRPSFDDALSFTDEVTDEDTRLRQKLAAGRSS